MLIPSRPTKTEKNTESKMREAWMSIEKKIPFKENSDKKIMDTIKNKYPLIDLYTDGNSSFLKQQSSSSKPKVSLNSRVKKLK